MTHQEIADLLPLAAIDRLEPEEASTLREHLREGCPGCRADLRAYREAAAALAVALQDSGSDHRVWEQLEARLHANAAAAHSLARAVSRPIHADRPERRSSGGGGWGRAIAAIAVAAAVALAFYNRSILKDGRRSVALHLGQLEMLNWELRSARTEIAALREELASSTAFDHLLMRPDVRLIRLAPATKSASGAAALVAVSAAGRQAMLSASGLSPAPHDATYELWWITRRGSPIRAALFDADSDHAAIASVAPPPDGSLTQAMVTLEPAGGADRPSGETFLKGVPERE
jgi:Anti-sigma-K factor rskA, C-terminal